MLIPYTQINPFILNAFKLTYRHILAMQPQITFVNYVKSQLHTNIVSSLFDRTIINYDGAYKYINGDKSRLADFKIVLRWYYIDMSNFVFKSIENLDKDFSLLHYMEVPRNEVPRINIPIDKVVTDLHTILEERKPVEDGVFNYFKYLTDINFEVRSNLKPSNILAEALIMKYIASQDEIEVIDIGD